MSLAESVSVCFSKYANFTGRASLSEYWWFFLFSFIVGIASKFIEYTFHVGGISLIVSLALFLPGLSAMVRRCHDTNHSGWWALCPVFNFIIMLLPSDRYANQYD